MCTQYFLPRSSSVFLSEDSSGALFSFSSSLSSPISSPLSSPATARGLSSVFSGVFSSSAGLYKEEYNNIQCTVHISYNDEIV